MAVEAACCGRKEPGGAASDRPCPPSGAALSAAENSSGADRQQLTHAAVADYYGRVLQSSRDLKTSACTAGGKPPELLRQVKPMIPHSCCLCTCGHEICLFETRPGCLAQAA